MTEASVEVGQHSWKRKKYLFRNYF